MKYQKRASLALQNACHWYCLAMIPLVVRVVFSLFVSLYILVSSLCGPHTIQKTPIKKQSMCQSFPVFA